MASLIPSVAFLSLPEPGAGTAALERALFDEEDGIDAPLGGALVDAAGEDQWLDEVGLMRDQIEHTRHSAAEKIRRTELQAARLAEVMSRTADARVAAARRWAAREAHKHDTLKYEEGREWADMVAHIKMDASELKEDLDDVRAEKLRLHQQLAKAALRSEKERRIAEKAREDAVSQAWQEATAAATEKFKAVVASSTERATRAEARLTSAAAEWAEQLARAEAREAEVRDLLRVAETRVAAELKDQLVSATTRANAAEEAQRSIEVYCCELEKKSKEEELRRVIGREAAVLELQATQSKLEKQTAQVLKLTTLADSKVSIMEKLQAQLAQKNELIEDMTQREKELRAEFEGVHERLEQRELETSTLGRLLGQRSGELELLRKRQDLRWMAYRRVWIRMCCRLLTGMRTYLPLFAVADSSASECETETEIQAHEEVSSSASQSDESDEVALKTTSGLRRWHHHQHAWTLGRRLLSPDSARHVSTGPQATSDSEVKGELQGENVKSPELEAEDLECVEQHEGAGKDYFMNGDPGRSDAWNTRAPAAATGTLGSTRGDSSQHFSTCTGSAGSWSRPIAFLAESESQSESQSESESESESESFLEEEKEEQRAPMDSSSPQPHAVDRLWRQGQQRADELLQQQSPRRAMAEPTNRQEAEELASWQLNDERAGADTGSDSSDTRVEPARDHTRQQRGPARVESVERREQDTHRRQAGTEHRTEAIFPLLERNPWLLAVMPLVLLFMLTPVVIYMTPARPPRAQ